MTPSLALPLLVLVAAPPLAAAQASPDLSRVPYDKHFAVQTAPGGSVDWLAAVTGSTVVHSNRWRGKHLLAAAPGMTDAQFQQLVTAVKGAPGIIYASQDGPSDSPESADCGPDGETIGAQQCTIAFIDGDPSISKFNTQVAGDQIGAAGAHASAPPGEDVIVAVIDTGIDDQHDVFAGKVAPGGWDYVLGIPGGLDLADGIDDDADGLVDEGVGHGTHVAGLVLLANPNAKILSMRALDSEGNGSCYMVSEAIMDAVDLGADVVNLSLSMRVATPTVVEALMYAEYAGALVVTSAGNANEDTLFPGSYDPADWTALAPAWLPEGYPLTGDNLIAIAGVNAADLRAHFSCYGVDCDLSAPSVDVYSAQIAGKWAWWSGTSMGSGVASGAVSFVLSIWDAGSYAGTPKELLMATAFDVDSLNPGYEGLLGAGRIDLGAATALLLGP